MQLRGKSLGTKLISSELRFLNISINTCKKNKKSYQNINVDISKFNSLCGNGNHQTQNVYLFKFINSMVEGLNPTSMRGSNTAVVVATTNNDYADWWSADPSRVNGYEFLGCTRTMFPNRISFSFDLRGININVVLTT